VTGRTLCTLLCSLLSGRHQFSRARAQAFVTASSWGDDRRSETRQTTNSPRPRPHVHISHALTQPSCSQATIRLSSTPGRSSLRDWRVRPRTRSRLMRVRGGELEAGSCRARRQRDRGKLDRNIQGVHIMQWFGQVETETCLWPVMVERRRDAPRPLFLVSHGPHTLSLLLSACLDSDGAPRFAMRLRSLLMTTNAFYAWFMGMYLGYFEDNLL
jgi:hypothetical protein